MAYRILNLNQPVIIRPGINSARFIYIKTTKCFIFITESPYIHPGKVTGIIAAFKPDEFF